MSSVTRFSYDWGGYTPGSSGVAFRVWELNLGPDEAVQVLAPTPPAAAAEYMRRSYTSPREPMGASLCVLVESEYDRLLPLHPDHILEEIEEDVFPGGDDAYDSQANAWVEELTARALSYRVEVKTEVHVYVTREGI